MPEQPSVFAGIKVLSGERTGVVLYPLGIDTIIGRLQAAQLFVPDMRSSRKHCLVAYRNDRYFLIDMSSNGTSLNGERVQRTAETPLQNGDIIQIGTTEMELRIAQTPATARPAPNASGPPVANAPAPAAGQPPGMEFVFDFEGETTDSGGLDRVFYDFEEKDKWSSLSTQRMPNVRDQLKRREEQQDQQPPPPAP